MTRRKQRPSDETTSMPKDVDPEHDSSKLDATTARESPPTPVDSLAPTCSINGDATYSNRSLSTGASIGPYKLEKCIGEGGMGSVWIAIQRHPVSRRVALKLIKSGLGSGEILVRFEAERQALALMNHSNIARILDAGTSTTGQPYFAMELVDGTTLTKYCDRKRLTIEQRLSLFCDVCAGVQHAHQKGIIHRDLKPSNILVTTIDDKPVAKVIDFGLAKAMQTAQPLSESTLHTGIGQILGTLKYMSPEQAGMGAIDIDTRTDVYSLGVVLYELLVGKVPLDDQQVKGQPVLETLKQIRESEVSRPSNRLMNYTKDRIAKITGSRQTDPSHLKGILLGDLDWIVVKALEKDRARRYESVASFAKDISRYLNHEPIEARPPSKGYLIKKFVRKNRLVVTMTGILAASLIAGIVGTTWGMFAANRARAAEAVRADAEEKSKLQSEKRLKEVENGNKILTDIFKDFDIRKRDDSSPIEAILARRLIEAGNRLNAENSEAPLSVAKMKSQLGYSILSLGFADESIALFNQAVEIQKHFLGAQHPDTLESRNGLAEGLHHLGKTDEAMAMFEQIVTLRKDNLGEEDPDTLTSMNNLAECYRVSGLLDKALPLMNQTWELRKSILGEDSPETLVTLNNLALSLHESGDLKAAISMYDQSLKLTKKKLGPEHAESLGCMNNLASAYFSVGRIDEALTLLQKTLELTRSKLGIDHPDTLRSMNNFAEATRASGDLKSSIGLYQQTVKLMNSKLGPQHPDTLTCMTNLAESRVANENLESGISGYEEVIRRMQANPNTEHPYLLVAMQGLAVAHWTGGDLDSAASQFNEVLEIQDSTIGRDKAATLTTIANLGIVFRDSGRLDEAIPLLTEASNAAAKFPALSTARTELRTAHAMAGDRDAFEQMLKKDQRLLHEQAEPNSLNLASELSAIGSDLLTLGDDSAAEPILSESLQIRRKLIPNDWRMFNTQSMLGEAMFGQARDIETSDQGTRELDSTKLEKQMSSAKSLLETAHQGLRKHFDSIPLIAREKRILESLDRLVEFASYAGDDDSLTRLKAERKQWLRTR